MKRSEWLKLADFRDELRERIGSGGGYYYDEAEGRYEDGKDSAYSSAEDDLGYVLKDMVVDVEDVTLCSSRTVFPFSGEDRPHELGSKPYAEYVHVTKGCKTCLEHWRAKG